MIISKKMYDIIRILFTTKINNISDVAREARITNAMASVILRKLEKSEYIKMGRNEISLINRIKLLKLWGYSYSIREFPNLQFIAAERPQYVMKKIINIAMKEKLEYAFTLFSATDFINPYVLASDVYMYISEKDAKRWEERFSEINILPTGKNGNVICILKDDDFFNRVIKINEAYTVSLYQLYADLLSWGGRGEEAAGYIMDIIVKTEQKSDKGASNV